MQRRCVMAGLAGTIAGAAIGVAPGAAMAATAAHRSLAEALFDLYAAQSVRLSITNAARQRPPGTAETLAPHVPAILRQLARHREPFADAMARALAVHVPEPDAGRIRDAVTSTPPTLDDRQRQMLLEADAEFRREAQAVIGAITADIALMIATTLAEASKSATR